MQAPESILKVWHQFDNLPMERFTKVWYAMQKPEPLQFQRTIEQMKAHYAEHKIAGNCFDLTFWLLDEFRKNGVEAYAVGQDMMTADAHVAVIARDEQGFKYLCDLGDQWIQPICVDTASEAFHLNDCEGYFPGATIQVLPVKEGVEIFYKRPNGKVSRQMFDLTPIDEQTLIETAELCQRNLTAGALFECRLFGEEVVHWEFYNWRSFTSSMSGLIEDESLLTVEEWATRIHNKTGYSYEILVDVLNYYAQLRDE